MHLNAYVLLLEGLLYRQCRNIDVTQQIIALLEIQTLLKLQKKWIVNL